MHTEPKLNYYQNAAVSIQLHIYSVIPRVGNSITTYNNKSSTFPRMLACKCRSIIIIMYIYHALINALSAHMIHINLNTIFYTCTAQSYQNNLINCYMDTHTHARSNLHTHARARTHARTHSDCCRNWISILVGAEIL